nr:carbohydrate ABC transporter permease [Paenibacillus nasutitermitis]
MRRNGTLMGRKRWSNKILVVLLAIGSLAMVIPFAWMVITSFDWAARIRIPFPPRIWPLDPSLKPYDAAFMNVPLLKYIWNSVVVAVGVIIVSLSSALLSGYALSKLKAKGSGIVLVAALSTMMIPFEITMIPQYLFFSRLHLTDSYWAFYLPALNYAFGTFLAKGIFDQLPGSLREAGIIDGAGELRVFRVIFLPLCMPIIATLIVLQFLAVWNDLLWPLLILNTPDKYTIQQGLAMFTYNRGTGKLPSITMAATTVSLVPVVVLYIFLQRYVVESVAMTGIKQ